MVVMTDISLTNKAEALKTIKSIFLLILISETLLGQSIKDQYRLWNQQSLSGVLSVTGYYRNQMRQYKNGIDDRITGTMLAGGFMLESKSFVVHPSLLQIDFKGEYNPEITDAQYTTIPDRSDVRTLKMFNLRTTFFQDKIVTLSLFINMNKSYIRRENFTNSLTNRKYFGGTFFYKSRAFPFSLSFQEGGWDQEEIETKRKYSYWQRNVNLQFTKSFFTNDKHRFTYSYNKYINRQSFTNLTLENTINFLTLNSSIPLDSNNVFFLNYFLSNNNQSGISDLNRFQLTTNITGHLLNNLELRAAYNYYDTQNLITWQDQHRFSFNADHQLYKSLSTSMFTDISKSEHNNFRENDFRVGFDFSYTKKTLLGQLNLSYSIIHRNYSRHGDPSPYIIVNEEHKLTDEKITLLDQPFVLLKTIVVKDFTGTLIYELNIDYLLYPQNDYVEIVRIPGGLIPDNADIFVDYTSMLTGDYKYKSNSQTFFISMLMFNRFLELYYRWGKQDYNDAISTELVALNYYLNNVYGVRLNIGIGQMGAEYDNYQSNIIPYELLRLFMNLNWRFSKKILFSLMGNVRYYFKIGNRVEEMYASVSGRMAYSFNSKMKLNMEFGYHNQKGYQINLDYLTAGTELTIIIRKINISIGADVYKRNYLNLNKTDFNGAHFSVARIF